MRQYLVCNIILLFISILPHNGYCVEQSPEQFVSEFYQWYFNADPGTTPAERNDAIYNYVAKQTVDDIRSIKIGNSDIYKDTYYFTKVGSYTADWKSVKTIIHPAMAIGNKLYVINVTFDTGLKKNDVIVSLTKENGKFYIKSVMDVFPDILE